MAGYKWKEKYGFTFQGISFYYKKKVKRVYIPTICFFVFFCVVLQNPVILEDWNIVLSLVTSTYNGRPEFVGTGATWYVFCLMWLYFSVPLLCFIFERINHKIIFIACLLYGFSIRIIWYLMGWDWYVMYTSPIINLDLFVCGFSVNYFSNINSIQINKAYRYTILFAFLCVILLNSYMWAFNWHMNLYRYVFASTYLILSCIYLWMFRADAGRNHDCFYIKKFIKKFSDISFEFYLFHSFVFYQISRHVGGHTAFGQWSKYVILGGIITYFFAYGFNKIFVSRK